MRKGWERAEGGGGKYTLWALFAMVRLEILRLCSIENSERTPRNLDYIHLESSLWQTDRSNAPPFRFTMTRGSGCHWKTWNPIAEVQITVLIIWRPEGVCVIYFSKLSVTNHFVNYHSTFLFDNQSSKEKPFDWGFFCCWFCQFQRKPNLWYSYF